mgnify:CR=1 FL=1
MSFMKRIHTYTITPQGHKFRTSRRAAQLSFILLAALLLAGASAASSANSLKLRPGARGKICLSCHTAFAEKMDKKYVHSPLMDGECTGCHSPHAAMHTKLMAEEGAAVCATCHDSMVPDKARSTHQVVVEGKCVACHDPHSADNRANLIQAGSDLCFSCHQELGEKIAANTFKHGPVQDDCLSCHRAHASRENSHLLNREVPALCLQCHTTDSAGFKRQHMGYPVQKARCTSCHDPHGSSTGALLADNVHEPISKKMCNQCHNEANSATPFALKKEGYELCQSCHYEMVNDTFSKNRQHWPMLDKTGCINCHSPHATAEPGLLRAPMLELCGSCHADTVARQERSQTAHPPIAQGECTTCHNAHASDNLFLFNETSTIEVCAQCHDWQTHSTHPIGEEVRDPRNKNNTLQCLSCHRTHGTEYKHFLHFPDVQALCVQCHTKYRR